MEDIIESVSRGLGWEVGERTGRNSRSVDLPGPRVWQFAKPFPTHMDVCDQQTLVLFAAYAKAEMAKRGYAMRTGKSGVYMCAYGPGSGDGTMTIRSHHACGHTDPVSVAEAELRCIADVLQSSAQDQRRV